MAFAVIPGVRKERELEAARLGFLIGNFLAEFRNRLDAWILFRTALIAITGRADATLADVPAWAWAPTVPTAPSAGGTFDPVDPVGPVIDLTFFEELETIDGLRPLTVDVDS